MSILSNDKISEFKASITNSFKNLWDACQNSFVTKKSFDDNTISKAALETNVAEDAKYLSLKNKDDAEIASVKLVGLGNEGKYVSKTGDTMTGNLNITSEEPSLTLKSTTLEDGDSPEEATGNHIWFKDKNDTNLGYFHISQAGGQRVGTMAIYQNGNQDNRVSFWLNSNADGKSYVGAATDTVHTTLGDYDTIATLKWLNNNLTMNQIKEPKYSTGISSPTIRTLIDAVRANRLAFLPADQIIIEKTTDGGVTWEDAGVSDSDKVNLFSEIKTNISIPLLDGSKSTLCGLRVTFTAMKYNVPDGTDETEKYNYWNSSYVSSTNRYVSIKDMYFWVRSHNDRITVKLERATGADSTNWVTAFDSAELNWSGLYGWTGNDYISFDKGVFGGSTSQTTNFWNYRLTFFSGPATTGGDFQASTLTSAQSIFEIRGYGDDCWNFDSNFMANDHLYTWDADKNATFPAGLNLGSALSVANGGTGATDAATARANIGAAAESEIGDIKTLLSAL